MMISSSDMKLLKSANTDPAKLHIFMQFIISGYTKITKMTKNGWIWKKAQDFWVVYHKQARDRKYL